MVMMGKMEVVEVEQVQDFRLDFIIILAQVHKERMGELAVPGTQLDLINTMQQEAVEDLLVMVVIHNIIQAYKDMVATAELVQILVQFGLE